VKWSIVSLAAAVVVLALADFLAFHDLFEPHSLTEWLMLVGSALVVVGLTGGLAGFRRTADGPA
jgi:hypothetical protein